MKYDISLLMWSIQFMNMLKYVSSNICAGPIYSLNEFNLVNDDV